MNPYNTQPIVVKPSLIDSNGGDTISISRHIGLREFPLHRHEHFEMEFIYAGNGVHFINGQRYSIRTGMLCVLLPWHAHQYRSESYLDISNVHFRIELFQIPGSVFYQIAEIVLAPPQAPPCVYFTGTELLQVEALFRKLESEQTVTDAYRNAMLQSIVAEILILFDRRRKACSENEKVALKQNDHLPIVEYINFNYKKPINLTDVCSAIGISPSAAKQALWIHFGMSFAAFLQKTRIEHACSLLKTTPFSVDQIAEEVGYRSVETFKKAFKREKHASPGTYCKSSLYSEYLEIIIRNLPDSKDLHDWIRSKAGRITNSDLIFLGIKLFIYQHFSEDLTLSDIAREFHFNETYLSEVLSKYGDSFSDILRDARVYHASVLLLTTDLPALEIGFIVGFNSTETFFRTFRAVNGLTPGEYRKKKQIPSDIEIPDGLNLSKDFKFIEP